MNQEPQQCRGRKVMLGCWWSSAVCCRHSDPYKFISEVKGHSAQHQPLGMREVCNHRDHSWNTKVVCWKMDFCKVTSVTVNPSLWTLLYYLKVLMTDHRWERRPQKHSFINSSWSESTFSFQSVDCLTVLHWAQTFLTELLLICCD